MSGSTPRRAALCAVILFSTAAVAATAGDLRLVEAVKNRDTARAQALIADRVAVDATEPDGATALHWAAHWDDVATADLLIRAGAPINLTNDYGVTPLALACQNGSHASAELVDRLLRAGANPNEQLPSGETVLMAAAFTGSVETVNALLAHGARVDANEPAKGQTALMWAVSERHPDVVRTLVDHGADVNARSAGQFTPLLFAARGGDVDMARLLMAASADLEAKAADGTTPLLMATVRGHVALVRALLDAGADPNADGPGFTALHWVAGKFESPGAVAYAQATGELASQIGIRPESGQLDLLKTLVAHGANPNARVVKYPGYIGAAGLSTSPPSFSAIGATPFWLAAKSADVAAMRLLVALGADPLMVANDRTTALMAAAGDASIGSKIPGVDTIVLEGARLEATRLALELGADLDAANARGNTALHAAVLSGFETITELLVARGAALNPRNKLGDTPLKAAEGFQAIMQVWVYRNVADMLRKAGGVARKGPPAPYEGTSVEYNTELRQWMEERAVLVDQLEALDVRKGSLQAAAYQAELQKLQTALAKMDEALKKYEDTTAVTRE